MSFLNSDVFYIAASHALAGGILGALVAHVLHTRRRKASRADRLQLQLASQRLSAAVSRIERI